MHRQESIKIYPINKSLLVLKPLFFFFFFLLRMGALSAFFLDVDKLNLSLGREEGASKGY